MVKTKLTGVVQNHKCPQDTLNINCQHYQLYIYTFYAPKYVTCYNMCLGQCERTDCDLMRGQSKIN